MRNKFLNYGLFFLVAVSFFYLGRGMQSFPETIALRDIATNESTAFALNSYNNLGCPTEAEFRQMMQDFKLIIESETSLDEKCDDSYRVKLAKVFNLMKTLKITPPKHWPIEIQKDLSDTYNFLKSNVTKLTLDLNQVDSLAYNRVSLKEIYISKRFFDLTPFDGVMILFHEARHSSQFDTGHTTCSAGDLPRTGGACDQEFSLEQNIAGAYSYGTVLSLSLSFYTEGLAESDRQFALLDAISQLGARFNKLPKELAEKVDVLVTLDNDGNLTLHHPFINASEKIRLKFPTPEEKAEKIEFSVKLNGLMVFTNLGKVYNWTPKTGLIPFFPNLLQGHRILSFNRVPVLFEEGTYFTFIDDNQNLKFIQYSPSQNSFTMKDYVNNFVKLPTQMPKLEKIFLGLYFNTIFLSDNGKVYIGAKYGNEDFLKDLPELNNSNNHYLYGTGGLIYDSLYLIGKDGLIYSTNAEIDENRAGEEDSTTVYYKYSLQKSIFQNSEGLLKFQEGLKINTALNKLHQIVVWKKSSLESRKMKLSNVKDFVLIQSTGAKDTLVNTQKTFSNFDSVCDVKTRFDDLWLGWGIGQNRSGNLVFARKNEHKQLICISLRGNQLEQLTPYFDSPSSLPTDY